MEVADFIYLNSAFYIMFALSWTKYFYYSIRQSRHCRVVVLNV